MVFTVDSTLLDEVKKPAWELRRKDLFEFRAFNATTVQVTRGTETRVFEKAKGQGKDATDKWRETKPAAKDLDAPAFDAFLEKLTSQRAQSFIDTGGKVKTGLESPVMVVVVRFDDGKKEEKVTSGRAGTDVYASDGRAARGGEDRRHRVRRRHQGAGRDQIGSGAGSGPRVHQGFRAQGRTDECRPQSGPASRDCSPSSSQA